MRIPGEGEYVGGEDFGTLAADEYRCKILSWEEHTQPVNQYNKDPNAISIWFKLQPLHSVDDPDAELLDKDTDEPISIDKTLLFFYDPKRTGLVPVIAKSRKFLAAALGVPVEEPIEFDGYDDLVGKEVICSVIVKKNKDGYDQNRIDAVRPAKKTKKPAAKADAPAVKAAKEVFKDEVKPEEDSEY